MDGNVVSFKTKTKSNVVEFSEAKLRIADLRCVQYVRQAGYHLLGDP